METNENNTQQQVSDSNSSDNAGTDDKLWRTRGRVIQELVETEEKYLQDLYVLSIFYITPLKNPERFPEISGSSAKGDVKVLFSTVEFIFEGNSLLLESLKKETSSSDFNKTAMIGKVFVNSVESICQYYGVFCNHQKEATDNIDKLSKTSTNFKSFLDQCKTSPETQGLGLLDYLIKPFQRLLKYPLLLKELSKNTPPDHPDAGNIKLAMDKLSSEVDTINTNKAKADNLKKMLEINSAVEGTPKGFKLMTPSRKHIFDGTLMKISGNHDQERHFFLFNDGLMYCKKKGGGKYLFRGLIYLNKLQVEDITDNPTSFKIFRTDKNLTYILYGQEKKEKDTWLFEIRAQQKKLNDFSVNRGTLVRSTQSVQMNKEVIRFYVTGEKTFKSFAATNDTTVDQLCMEALSKKVKATPEFSKEGLEYCIAIVIKGQEVRTLSGEEKILEVNKSQLKKDSKFGHDDSHFSLNLIKREGPTIIQRTISEKVIAKPLPPSRPPPTRSQTEVWAVRDAHAATPSSTRPPAPTTPTPTATSED